MAESSSSTGSAILNLFDIDEPVFDHVNFRSSVQFVERFQAFDALFVL